MTISALSEQQWVKVSKAAAYSFFSGFVGGIILASTSALQMSQAIDTTVAKALIVGGVVGGLNTLAVFIKQLFTPSDETPKSSQPTTSNVQKDGYLKSETKEGQS